MSKNLHILLSLGVCFSSCASAETVIPPTPQSEGYIEGTSWDESANCTYAKQALVSNINKYSLGAGDDFVIGETVHLTGFKSCVVKDNLTYLVLYTYSDPNNRASLNGSIAAKLSKDLKVISWKLNS